jgi:outer membrane lipoprotein-sorting protein
MRLQRTAALLALVAAAIVGATTAGLGHADLFDELYQRGQKQNGDLRTFTASFTETTSSSLLTKPLVARGTVAVERPSRVALRYTDPDARLVLIDGDRMTMSWPARGILETKDIGASQRRVQKYFVDSSANELRSHFDLTATTAADGSYSIVMIPKRKQIKEGLARLDLTIDPGTLLMRAMKMTFPNGDSKQMSFTDVKANVALDRSLFQAPK